MFGRGWWGGLGEVLGISLLLTGQRCQSVCCEHHEGSSGARVWKPGIRWLFTVPAVDLTCRWQIVLDPVLLPLIVQITVYYRTAKRTKMKKRINTNYSHFIQTLQIPNLNNNLFRLNAFFNLWIVRRLFEHSLGLKIMMSFGFPLTFFYN